MLCDLFKWCLNRQPQAEIFGFNLGRRKMSGKPTGSCYIRFRHVLDAENFYNDLLNDYPMCGHVMNSLRFHSEPFNLSLNGPKGVGQSRSGADVYKIRSYMFKSWLWMRENPDECRRNYGLDPEHDR